MPTGTPKTLALLYTWQGTSLVVVHNFDAAPCELRIKPDVDGAERLYDLFAPRSSEADDSGAHRIVLDGYGYRWFRAGTLNYALARKG